MARLSHRNSSEEGFGYTKWTFTREEIDIIEQEYEWFVSFYSLRDAAKCDDHRSTGISHQSEILSGSNYTNLISTGECNLSDDLDHKLCMSEECQKKENDVPLLDHWIEGISDNGTDEDQDGIEFFRLGVSHVDLLSSGSNDDESEGESSSNHSFRYAGISETKEIYADRSIKPQDSSTFNGRKYNDEIFVEFHLPVVYMPYKTGLEPSPKLELSNGDIVAGRYQVAAEIGSAAFSVAYHGIDMQESVGNPNVCLKVIQNSKDFLDLDEIKVLQLLQYGRDGNIAHPNPIVSSSHVCDLHHILHLRRYFYYKEHLILVTELLEDNLYEFDCKIRRLENFSEYFTLPRLCHITRQVLVALQYVHSLGLIHSDVKPENILMWSHQDAKVKLIDFGSACFTTDQLSSYVQSRSYRAPEVVLGLPYDSKIDLWSLGCVVAELFTGRVLFQNESIVEMLALVESVCGGFPRDMVNNGSKSPEYYLSSGLLCSKHNIEENDAQVELYDIYRPTRSKLEDWLGLPPATGDAVESQFLDFLRKLLTVDPANRLTAEDALAHPWILWGMLLTEDDVKYPAP
jgi:serine/threonine protein kinase